MTTLPDHVKRIVSEIETEIGDEPSLPVAMIEGYPDDEHAGRRRERLASRRP